MDDALSSLSTEELERMFHKINKELTNQFLNRVNWDEQQQRIESLSKISKELNRRSQGRNSIEHKKYED